MPDPEDTMRLDWVTGTVLWSRVPPQGADSRSCKAYSGPREASRCSGLAARGVRNRRRRFPEATLYERRRVDESCVPWTEEENVSSL